MIEEVTIKFGMELKPTLNSCKLQLYKTYHLSFKNPIKIHLRFTNFLKK